MTEGRVAQCLFKGWSEKTSLRKQSPKEGEGASNAATWEKCEAQQGSQGGWAGWPRKGVVGDEIQEVLGKADHGKDFAQRWETLGEF